MLRNSAYCVNIMHVPIILKIMLAQSAGLWKQHFTHDLL